MLKITVKFNTEMEKNLGKDILTYAACNEIKEEKDKLIGFTDAPREHYRVIKDYIFRRTYGGMKVEMQEVE